MIAMSPSHSFPPFKSNGSACVPDNCPAQPDWQHPLEEAIDKVISPLKPTQLIINSGLFRTLGQVRLDVSLPLLLQDLIHFYLQGAFVCV